MERPSRKQRQWRELERLVRNDQRDNGPAFQAMWALLHLVSTAMHIGSAVYHLKRIRSAKAKSPD